ncbi:hypothetical protein F5H01DRAFT_353582, partial [Linnemannia elongata]
MGEGNHIGSRLPDNNQRAPFLRFVGISSFYLGVHNIQHPNRRQRHFFCPTLLFSFLVIPHPFVAQPLNNHQQPPTLKHIQPSIMRTTSLVLFITALIILIITTTTLASSPSSIKESQSQSHHRRHLPQHESLPLLRRGSSPPQACPKDMGFCADKKRCCAIGSTCCAAGNCCPPNHYCISRPNMPHGCCPIGSKC